MRSLRGRCGFNVRKATTAYQGILCLADRHHKTEERSGFQSRARAQASPHEWPDPFDKPALAGLSMITGYRLHRQVAWLWTRATSSMTILSFRTRCAGGHWLRQEVYVLTRPCCMDRVVNALEPTPCLCLGDADGLRASKLKHPVQGMNCDGDLGRAAVFRPRAQRVSDHSFKPADGGLHQGSTRVPGPLLPAHASMLGDALEMPIALGRSGLHHPRSAPPLIAAER